MKQLYTFLLSGIAAITLNAQEVLTFSGYDGAGSNLTATISTVNDEITIDLKMPILLIIFTPTFKITFICMVV